MIREFYTVVLIKSYYAIIGLRGQPLGVSAHSQRLHVITSVSLCQALLPQESGNTQATIFFGTEPFFLPKAQNISREMGKSISTDPAVHDTLARIKKLSVVRHFLHIIVG